ncbi:signal peptidase I [Nocardioides sp. zg-DK7169]|nr:signal peptidase I [Nocardioides sp. zg-DK7169]
MHHRRLSVWQESLILLAAALVLSFIVKTFFVQAFYIPSGSMEPGMEVDDRILVQKVSYWGDGTPERGDAVVFEDPGGWLAGSASEPGGAMAQALSKIGLYPTGGHLVKRVIGVEGDVIRCCDDQGRLLINGVPLDSSEFTRNDEDCDGPMPTQDCSWSAGPVPPGHVFVMGDHRDASADSSVHLCRGASVETDCVSGEEFVPVELVVGKAFSRVWPADRIGLLHRPNAFDELARALGES